MWREVALFTPTRVFYLGLAESLTHRSGRLHEAQRAAAELLAPEENASVEWVVVTTNAFHRIFIAIGRPPKKATN